MKRFCMVMLFVLFCVSQVEAETLKILIPANANGNYSGVGIAFGESSPITQGTCKKQVCKYNVPNGTFVSLWRTNAPPQYEFDYWVQDGVQDDSQLLQFQMLSNTTVLMKENKINTGLPVIIVPGIFGSWSTKMFCDDEDAVMDMQTNLVIAQELQQSVYNTVIPSEWIPDPISMTYQSMYDSLSYERLQPVFFGYDWRQSLQYTAIGNPNKPNSPSLINIIDQVKAQYGVEQVDIVAHSMGGLIVREYIQNHYRGDIRKFAMIGTPNQGSLYTYRIWEAGQFSRMRKSLKPWIMEIILENMKEGCKNSFMKDAKFVRKWLPSVKQLLPTFDYFAYPTGVLEGEYYLAGVENMCHYNNYLLNLNDDIDSLINSGVDIHIFASVNKKTLQGFKSNNQPSSNQCNRIKWADKKPNDKFFANPDNGNAGDGRVLFDKSAYPVNDIPIFTAIPITVVKGSHGSLPQKANVIKEVIKFLKDDSLDGEPAPY